jgi:uncharacterized damage-inducible protein DinB
MATELWLSGRLTDVHPFLAPLLYSFEMAREDIERCIAGLTPEQIWAQPGGAASLGFHVRHIGGSIDRLLTYAEGRQLEETQIAAMKQEGNAGASADELLAGLSAALTEAEKRVRAFDPARLEEPRGVGRKLLPTTLAGLLIHIAEHTQRHTGQAVTTARFVRAQ